MSGGLRKKFNRRRPSDVIDREKKKTTQPIV